VHRRWNKRIARARDFLDDYYRAPSVSRPARPIVAVSKVHGPSPSPSPPSSAISRRTQCVHACSKLESAIWVARLTPNRQIPDICSLAPRGAPRGLNFSSIGRLSGGDRLCGRLRSRVSIPVLHGISIRRARNKRRLAKPSRLFLDRCAMFAVSEVRLRYSGADAI